MNSYRYGYQGEYAEDETEEDGIKANSFQLRLYNPRLGRWLSPDPYGQYVSPYLAMGNNPTNSVDPDGGFSWGGALWRSVLGGHGAISKVGDEWGYNNSDEGMWQFADGENKIEYARSLNNPGPRLQSALNIIDGIGELQREKDFYGLFDYDVKYYNSVEERDAAGAESRGWVLGKISSQVILPNIYSSGVQTAAIFENALSRFGSKLFLSNRYGISSRLFGSSAAKAQGGLNVGGGYFKAGWSTGVNRAGEWGYKFRIGLGRSTANPNIAKYHLYVPFSWVSNSFANATISLRIALMKMGMK